MKEFKEQLFKILSRNDTGETGGHQSGISIPKAVASSIIFPRMSTKTLNPRQELVFTDEGGTDWVLNYIYYNDKYHGKPIGKCHDEFRLTGTNAYIKAHNIKSGDQNWFAIDADGKRHIGYVRKGHDISSVSRLEEGKITLKIRSWTTIKR